MDAVKLALVGVGRMGEIHASNAMGLKGKALVVAIVDSVIEKAEAVAKLVGDAKVYESVDRMLVAVDVDAAIVSVPNNIQLSIVEQLVDNGIHILCEKPVGLIPEHLEELALKAERKNVQIHAGYNRPFDQGYEKAKNFVESGGVGKVTYIHSQTLDPEPPKGWEADPTKSGGIFFTTCVHDFQTVIYLTGRRVQKVRATGSVYVHDDLRSRGDFDDVFVKLWLDNGVVATVRANRFCSYGHDVRVEVYGTRGAIRIEQESHTPIKYYGAEGVLTDYPYWFQTRFWDSYKRELEYFIKAVSEGLRPRVSAFEAAHILRVARAAHESAKNMSEVVVA
jgi:myo-inositol 2-dehydrogenase/D-chiro-inositol 1-dehydrogenase